MLHLKDKEKPHVSIFYVKLTCIYVNGSVHYCVAMCTLDFVHMRGCVCVCVPAPVPYNSLKQS
jgi:hypothetical protein